MKKLWEYVKQLFTGRISVADYWIGFMPLLIIFLILLNTSKNEVFISIVVFMFIFFHSSLYARRFHDHNKSAWNVLWLSFPPLYLFYGFILIFLEGTKGRNDYGELLSFKEEFIEKLKRVYCIS